MRGNVPCCLGFIFCRSSAVYSSVKPSFNPFLHCAVWCYIVILMIICACISPCGIPVRLGWFGALSTALSLNQLFLQTNFTAVILIKRSAHCDFLFFILFQHSSADSVMCEWGRGNTKGNLIWKTFYLIKFFFLLFFSIRVNNQTNIIGMFCICHTSMALNCFYFKILNLCCVV